MMLLRCFLVICVLEFIMASVDREFSVIDWALRRQRKNHKQLQVATGAETCDNVQEYYFHDAIQDNFASAPDIKRWEGKGQRYFMNDIHWGGPGAPIFLYIGGEGPESCNHLTESMFVYTLAKQHNALLISLEHRFYGESYPTHDMSNENLKLLSSQQALADLARFLNWKMTDLITTNSKVITVGGSYPGNLSGWFREKYPSLTIGAIASSAPVVAQADFHEYLEVVADGMNYFDESETKKCVSNTRAAVEKVSDMMKTVIGGLQITHDFKLCDAPTSLLDWATFAMMSVSNFQGVSQYNNEQETAPNLSQLCGIMTTSGKTPYENYVAFNTFMLNYYSMECMDTSWNSTINPLKAEQKDYYNNMRPWVYQTCNEFGYYQTANGDANKQPWSSFSNMMGVWYDQLICKEAFGFSHPLPETQWTNTVYGGRKNAATNVLFVHGSIDPWHALGITDQGDTVQDSEYAVYIEGTAHCADLYAEKDSDPQSMKDAHAFISTTVNQWLAPEV